MPKSSIYPLVFWHDKTPQLPGGSHQGQVGFFVVLVAPIVPLIKKIVLFSLEGIVCRIISQQKNLQNYGSDSMKDFKISPVFCFKYCRNLYISFSCLLKPNFNIDASLNCKPNYICITNCAANEYLIMLLLVVGKMKANTQGIFNR